MTTKKTTRPPFPRLGEVYRAMAVALGTKGSNPQVDELASRGDFDWSLLPALTRELFVAPLAKYVDADLVEFVQPWFEHMHTSYIGMVSRLAIESLTREEALPILIEHYFVPHGLKVIYAIQRELGGPDPMTFLDPDRHPVAAVMEWLETGEANSLARLAYDPGNSDIDRNETEKCRKWSKGLDLPDLPSIVRLGAALKKKGAMREGKINHVRRWLLLARAVAHFERASGMPIRNMMRRHLLLGMPDGEILKAIEEAVVPSLDRFSKSIELGQSLHNRLLRTSTKQSGEKEKTRADLDQLEQMLRESPGDGRFDFQVNWLKARWHMLSAEFESALSDYETAVQGSSYRAGEKQQPLLAEALVVAALLGKKAALKRLKHLGVVFGLFTDPRTEILENWEIEQLRQQFGQMFPATGRFLEASREEKITFPFLMLDTSETKKPDLRNPDRIVTMRAADGQIRRWTQLRRFVSEGKYDSVEALLNAGASVDFLDDSGASALLVAIQTAMNSTDWRVLSALLRRPHSSATIDSVTAKKRFTPLFCAVDLGDPVVVETLLSMGATADLRADIADQTPLYYALSKIAIVKKPDALRAKLDRSFLEHPDEMQREVFRRYNISLAGAFGDGDDIRTLCNDPHYAELFEKVMDVQVAEQVGRHTLPKLLRIIELLLIHKADPNASHTYPAPGRTPLMLAVENDCTEAFELMHRFGGDPLQCDAEGMNCLRMALTFASADVLATVRAASR
ncbi:ankyrin repeat domain-containing protein [Paraburkholderia xenovorans]|uniref:ankyrin repeat domain-containing protein n=1 Tax=Paraburkholderia xenovorans TaxID=36873 RepID=UPI0038BA12CD